MIKFKDKIVGLLQKVENDHENLESIANKIVDCIEKGGKFYVFGTGHSHIIGEEFYARAGGLANVYMIAPSEVTLSEHPQKSTMIERIPEYAEVIYYTNKIKKEDIVMICSNSGRNACLVELAILCKQRGTQTIALTSLQHSKSSASRHKCGKNLYQICDYVIDNFGVIGDASMELDHIKGKMGSTSTIIGCYIVQTLNMLIALEMQSRHLEVPVFISSNLDGGDEWNQSLMEKYYSV